MTLEGMVTLSKTRCKPMNSGKTGPWSGPGSGTSRAARRPRRVTPDRFSCKTSVRMSLHKLSPLSATCPRVGGGHEQASDHVVGDHSCLHSSDFKQPTLHASFPCPNDEARGVFHSSTTRH